MTIIQNMSRLRPLLAPFLTELSSANPPATLRETVALFQQGKQSYEKVLEDAADWINEGFRSQIKTRTSEAAYTPTSLKVYDALVWGFNSPFHWRISQDEVQQLFADCMKNSKTHAEVAVGTGLFLCNLPSDTMANLETISLLDLNPDALEGCLSRLNQVDHYKENVQIDKVKCDILAPIPEHLQHQFDSVGANFLFHCLHGESIQDKRSGFEACAALLKEDGTFFGSTILGKDMIADQVNAGRAAMKTLDLYNDMGVFGNKGDTYEDVESVLDDLFNNVEVWRWGYCAAWKARNPKRSS